MFVCVIAVAAAEVLQAADEDIRIMYDGRTDSRIEFSSRTQFDFWKRFETAFDDSTTKVFADRFHPLSAKNWTIQLAGKSTRSMGEKYTTTAFDALGKSMTYSLREAAISFPAVANLEENQGLLADFFIGTVDDVDEESVSPLDPTFGLAERSWWGRLSESRRLHYGLRPLRTDPYAFVSFAVKDGKTPLLLGHMRYYYDSFTDHRFEFAFSLPVAHGCSFDVGTSYQFGMHDEQKKLVLKFLKEFKSGGIVHVGLEAQEHPSLFAGISLPL